MFKPFKELNSDDITCIYCDKMTSVWPEFQLRISGYLAHRRCAEQNKYILPWSQKDSLDRPDWDTYYMTLCFLMSSRSIDPSTKHAAIAVDQENTPLACGYNSPPRGCDDSSIPLTRPEKYSFIKHAEQNLICNAARNGISLRNSRMYVTGQCCELCLGEVINAGISEIIQGPQKSNCINDKSLEIKNIILKGQKLKIRDFTNISKITHLFKSNFDRISSFENTK